MTAGGSGGVVPQDDHRHGPNGAWFTCLPQL